jgi:hypothetical protein
MEKNVASSVFTSIEQIAVLQDANKAVSFIPQLKEVDLPYDTMRVVTSANQKAFQTVCVVLAALAAAGSLLSVLTKEKSLEKDGVGGQGLEAE